MTAGIAASFLSEILIFGFRCSILYTLSYLLTGFTASVCCNLKGNTIIDSLLIFNALIINWAGILLSLPSFNLCDANFPALFFRYPFTGDMLKIWHNCWKFISVWQKNTELPHEILFEHWYFPLQGSIFICTVITPLCAPSIHTWSSFLLIIVVRKYKVDAERTCSPVMKLVLQLISPAVHPARWGKHLQTFFR